MTFFGQTVLLKNNITDINLVDIFAPFTLTVNPKDVSFSKKIRAIEYVWGDGEKTLVNYKPLISSNGNLPFPNDAGNPLNYPQTHIFSYKDFNLSVYTITVNFYLFGTSETQKFTIQINLKNPSLRDNLNGFFTDFHLIKTRMFGPDNEILYVFQTQNPDYILMSTVKWNQLPLSAIEIKKADKPYKRISPLENHFNLNIRNVPYIKDVPVNLDNGGIN